MKIVFMFDKHGFLKGSRKVNNNYILKRDRETFEKPIETWPPIISIYVDPTWETIVDYRGKTVYNTTTKESLKIKDVGPIPSNHTELIPGPFDSWDGSKWVTDEIAKHQYERDTAAKSAMLEILLQLVKNDDPQLSNDFKDAINLILLA